MKPPPPTLDALAANPALAVALPAPIVAGLLSQLAAAQSALSARAVTLSFDAADPAPSNGADRLLTVAEAAQALAVSRAWVYRRSKTLPFAVRLDGGALRFSATGIEKYLRARRR